MFLLDTSVVSFAMRADPLLERYRDELSAKLPIFLSAQTVAELYLGAAQNNWGTKRLADLERHIAGYPILAIDRDTAARYARVHAEGNFCRHLNWGVNWY